jgi:hypothetical protein
MLHAGIFHAFSTLYIACLKMSSDILVYISSLPRILLSIIHISPYFIPQVLKSDQPAVHISPQPNVTGRLPLQLPLLLLTC